MKTFAFAALAACAVSLSAQNPAPSPLPPVDQSQPFQLPPALSRRAPQFKLQLPGGDSPNHFVPQILIRPLPQPKPNRLLDQGIVIHPPKGSFEPPQSRPSMLQNLYPGLTIQPTELAGLAPLPSLWPNAKVIPIPITWPHARVEPIPRNVDGFKAFPAQSSGLSPSQK